MHRKFLIKNVSDAVMQGEEAKASSLYDTTSILLLFDD